MRLRAPRGRTATTLAAALAVAGASLTGLSSGPASAADTLLPQGEPATASPVGNRDYTPARGGFDGGLTARWASATIISVRLDRERAHATAYQALTSPDDQTGTPASSYKPERGGVLDANGRPTA